MYTSYFYSDYDDVVIWKYLTPYGHFVKMYINVMNDIERPQYHAVTHLRISGDDAYTANDSMPIYSQKQVAKAICSNENVRNLISLWL